MGINWYGKCRFSLKNKVIIIGAAIEKIGNK
jgi:hypothetical protein